MEFTEHEVEGVVVITLSGEIEIYNTGPLKAEVQQLIADKKVRLVLSMAGVPYIDSTGIGMLLLLQKNLRGAGGALKLAKISSAVYEVFRLTKLLPLLEIFDSEEAAIGSFR